MGYLFIELKNSFSMKSSETHFWVLSQYSVAWFARPIVFLRKVRGRARWWLTIYNAYHIPGRPEFDSGLGYFVSLSPYFLSVYGEIK